MKAEKDCEDFAADLFDKKEYFIHIRNLKQVLNHGIIFEKVHIFFKFNKEAWLTPHIDINANL